MPILNNYTAFAGRHYETGTIHNALAYQGVRAPHTNAPYSEALLLGVSGGAAFGYFTFHYDGLDPQLNLITRNTFDPLETLLDRLAIPHDILGTGSAKTAEKNLLEVLENGQPAIVWASVPSLPYSTPAYADFDHYMLPSLVYGHADGTVHIADRAGVPFTVSAEQLAEARGAVKKFKHRLMTVQAPNAAKLATAVTRGIWSAISLYTEAPPKGARHNFGLAAYDHWAKMLTNTRNKNSWERYFPAGSGLYSALSWGYMWITDWGAGEGFERGMYADFLDEAAVILEKGALREAAATFRESAAAWLSLGAAMLPDEVPPLRETRDLMDQRRHLFITQGETPERRTANERLAAIKAEVAADFPMSADEVTAFRANLAEHVLNIRDIEASAVEVMQAAMA
jgi:hypothetical protein